MTVKLNWLHVFCHIFFNSHYAQEIKPNQLVKYICIRHVRYKKQNWLMVHAKKIQSSQKRYNIKYNNMGELLPHMRP
jgi:hypothetical protein